MDLNCPHQILEPILPAWGYAPYLNMLYEDYQAQLVPIAKSPVYDLAVAWTDVNSVLDSLSLEENHRGVDSFLKDVGMRLLLRGEVWLYMLFGQEHEGRGHFMVFEITGVRPGRNGTLVQMPPDVNHVPEYLSSRNSWAHASELDLSRVIRVTLPDAYPFPVLSKVVGQLSRMHFPETPKWASDEAAGQGRDNPRYDVQEAYRTFQIFLSQVVREIGWTAREEFMETYTCTNQYYWSVRNLIFQHFLASMRERAEVAVSQVLSIAGSRCGFAATVSAHGAYTAAEIEQLIHQFKEGGISFSDAASIQYSWCDRFKPKVRRVL